MLEICDSRNISPALVVWPKDYAEHRQASARAAVVREMARQGVSVKNIQKCCPLTESAIRKSLRPLTSKPTL